MSSGCRLISGDFADKIFLERWVSLVGGFPANEDFEAVIPAYSRWLGRSGISRACGFSEVEHNRLELLADSNAKELLYSAFDLWRRNMS
jgi:hypothetical protein